jgi:hypothetical protein
MLVLAPITKWVDSRDSRKRAHARDIAFTGYREFLINPNRISDLKDRSTLVLARSSFLFSDNHRDRRENNSYVECNLTPTQIQTAHDTAFHSKFITLPFCPKNNPLKTPVDTTLDVEDLAYFDRYNDDPDNFCWLVYNRKAFRRVEQLVAYNIEQVEDIAETGTTTTTTTTPEEQ